MESLDALALAASNALSGLSGNFFVKVFSKNSSIGTTENISHSHTNGTTNDDAVENGIISFP